MKCVNNNLCVDFDIDYGIYNVINAGRARPKLVCCPYINMSKASRFTKLYCPRVDRYRHTTTTYAHAYILLKMDMSIEHSPTEINDNRHFEYVNWICALISYHIEYYRTVWT